MPISVSLNVTLLDKKKFVKGKRGVYCDIVLWETPDSDFGDYMVKQRGESGERTPILGNAKNFEVREKLKSQKRRGDEEEEEEENARIPF
jgi:hypothetical protein